MNLGNDSVRIDIDSKKFIQVIKKVSMILDGVPLMTLDYLLPVMMELSG